MAGKPKYLKKTCPDATLSTTNPTWPDPGFNPGRRGRKPATNRFSYGAANNKLTVGGIFCDVEKAFDCVNHNMLLSKLEFYEVVGKFNILISSFLKYRYQKVLTDNRKTHNSTSSGWEIVKHGVSQGSILGPLFFPSIYQ
jgi:hypothetical protein